MPAECGERGVIVTPVTVCAPPLSRLTERETQALILITAGLSLAEVGEAMGVSMSTAKTYSATILDVFGLKNSRNVSTLALLSGTVTAEQVIGVWQAWRPWLVR